MKKVFTIEEVARICNETPEAVGDWFNSGLLPGYYTPGSGEPRIPREQLTQFLREYEMPRGGLEKEEWHKILMVVWYKQSLLDQMYKILPNDSDFKYQIARNEVEAGILAERFRPDTIVIDLADRRSEAIQIVMSVRFHWVHETPQIIGLADADEGNEKELISHGFSAVLKTPFKVNLLCDMIRAVTDRRSD